MLLSAFGGMCTATLVGKKTVLTAAHCVQPGGSYTFKLGSQSYAAASVQRHSNYGGGSYDIGLALLSSEPQGVTPSPVATTAPSVGDTITLVGFGATSCNVGAMGQVSCTQDAGVKRIATNKIHSRSSIEFTFIGSGGGVGSTCKGDSGGPAFATLNGQEVVVGVTSRGDMPCGKTAIDTRVDPFVSWIEQKAGGDDEKGGTTPPPPPPPPDDTEPPRVVIVEPVAGSVIQASVTVKATITDDKGVLKAELVVDGVVQASLAQSPFEFPAALTPGSHLLEVVGYDAAGNQGKASVNVTVPGGTPEAPGEPAPPPGSYGTACEDDADCQSGMCAEDPDLGIRYCTQTCQPGQWGEGACPENAACLPTNVSDTHVCGPPPGQTPMLQGGLLGGCSLYGGRARRIDPGLAVLALVLLLAFTTRRCW